MERMFTAAVHQEEDWHVARCLEIAVASQGRSADEAVSNLAEAVELQLEEAGEPPKHHRLTAKADMSHLQDH